MIRIDDQPPHSAAFQCPAGSHSGRESRRPTGIIPEMTLVLAVRRRDSVWVLADRRLTYGAGRVLSDDATKVMDLQTSPDMGTGLLAYAGIGKTARGTEPSDWMSNTLRGIEGLTVEESLSVLVDAANREMPRRLRSVSGGGATHSIVAMGFAAGGPFAYGINTRVDATGDASFQFIRFARSLEPGAPPARMLAAGTGGVYFDRQPRDRWKRPLFRLLKANDSGAVSSEAVADYMASINQEVHLGMVAEGDNTVGPRCIVAWRARHGSGKSGGHQNYVGAIREPELPALPSIANGLDLRALMQVHIDMMREQEARYPGQFAKLNEIDQDELERRVGALPTHPDGRLT